jgi:radical SAM superfamily enzyme YgiQ (UPF0313 family)
MRVLLVQPWITDFAAYDLWVRPLGLLYIAGRLRSAGVQVDFINCLDRAHPALVSGKKLRSRADGTGAYYREVVEKPACLTDVPRTFARYGLPKDIVDRQMSALALPDAILVGSGMTYWYSGVKEMIALLRVKYGDIPIMLGGIYATLAPDHARRQSGADMVLPGEGEQQVLCALEELCGVSFDSAPACESLDDYPSPSVDLMHDRRSLAVLTTRGCPYHCSFCASRRVSGQFRRRTPELVVEEVLQWERDFGTTDIAFYDDALLIQAEQHFLPILEGFIKSGVNIRLHTPNGLFAAMITPEVARLMHQAGVTTVRLSLETTNPDRRDDIGRKVAPDSFMRGLQALLQAGYRPEQIDVYLIMGLPGQQVAEVMESVQFCTRLGVKVRLAAFSPIPGTEEWDRAILTGAISAEDDLLLTNNTVLPLRSKEFTWKTVERLRHWVATLNKTPLNQRRLLMDVSPRTIMTADTNPAC